MNFTDSQTQKLKKLMLASTKPAYFVMDQQGVLLECSDNLSDYGYADIAIGQDCFEFFDFLIGYTLGDALDLPIVTAPNGVHSSISILPEENQINVLLMDASHDFDRQFRLQQTANEAELLSQRQHQLMKQLLDTQKELAEKNQQLEESSRLQTRFLSGVSHEFRTPLTSIIGYSETLSSALSEDQKQQADIVKSSAKYLLSLVENLLDHGRLDAQALSIQPKTVVLNDFFAGLAMMLQPMAEQKGIHLECVGHDCDYTVFIDETRVRQCIINIANNAIKFTDHGAVKIHYEWLNHELFVSVSDTGIGMNEAELEKMFVSFWQSTQHDRAGAGLGLTITKRLLDRMGGDISVSSVLNQGTTMRLSFPAAIVEADALTQEGVDEFVATSPNQIDELLKVLLVEDDPDIAALIEVYMLEWGYQYECVGNGQLAVDWLREHEADIVFMDLNMPIMGGAEAIKMIRQNGHSVPIYIMSAKNLDAVDDQQLAALAQGHLLKPIDFAVLKETIEQIPGDIE